jgi:hypothetical protein
MHQNKTHLANSSENTPYLLTLNTIEILPVLSGSKQADSHTRPPDYASGTKHGDSQIGPLDHAFIFLLYTERIKFHAGMQLTIMQTHTFNSPLQKSTQYRS